MPRKVATAALTNFFEQEHQGDSNATLRSARNHLQELVDAAPGDAVPEAQQLLTETEELIQVHDEFCPLEDFLPPRRGTQTPEGPGIRG